MSKILLAAAFLIISHIVLTVDCCVSSAEKEAMYGEILARAQQRRATWAATPQDLGILRPPRKYSVEQTQLINDVTLIFGNSMPVSEKFEHFKLLMTQLGITEEPVSIQRFYEFSGFIKRHQSGQDKRSNRGKTSKIVPPASEKLAQMLSEKASLTCEEAFEALEKSGVVPLPSMKDIQGWLSYRRKVSGFLNLLEEPCVDRKTATVETSAFLRDDESGSSKASQSNTLRVRVGQESRYHAGDNDKAPKYDFSETYKMLLRNAMLRRERTFLRESSKQFTYEHDAVVMDVVKTFNRDASIPRQYEIFKKLIEDLGMVAMAQSSFAERAGAARRFLGGDPFCKKKTPSVGVAASQFLDSLFDNNPKITGTEALKALEAQPLDGNSALPSCAKVRHWLKHRRAMRRFSDDAFGISNKRQKLEQPQSGSLSESNEVDFWNELTQALADEGEDEMHSVPRTQNSGNDEEFWREVSSVLAANEVWCCSSSSSSLLPNCIDDVGLWKEVALALEDQDAGGTINEGQIGPEGFAGSSSEDQGSSRKRNRND